MMRAFFLSLILIAALVTAVPAPAQRKITASMGIWPGLQLSYGVGENGLLFFWNQYRINTDSRFNDLRENGILSNVERIQFSLGYEQAFNDHWRGGALWRYAVEDYPTTSFYSLFLRHSGAVRSLYFNKQFLFEYVDQEGQDAAARHRLLAELGKRFPLKQRFLTPSVSYEGALFTSFKEEKTTTEERFIDRSRLRLDLTCEVNTKLYITPYFMRQTDFYYVEIPPVYNEDDILVTNGYRTRRNRITPVFGIEVKYNLNREVNTGSIAY